MWTPEGGKTLVIIKLIYERFATGAYGTDVHRLLSSVGRAPVIYGQSPPLEGAPIAYVMERLPPN